MRCMRRIERMLVFVIAALVVLVAPTAVPLFAQEAWADEAAVAPADDSPRDDSSLGTAKSLSVDCSAAMVDGYALIGPGGTLTYTMVVTAGGDAGEMYENVCVTGDFIDDSERKVDLSSMALASATVGGADIRARVSPLSAAPNTVKGWNIGSLQAGETVSIVFTVRIDVDGISDAVSAEKWQAPATDARAARTIRLAASAAAEGVATVSDVCSVTVRNSVSVTKSLGRYDAATQTQHFTITVSAAPDNPYLMYYLPLYDEVTSAANAGAIAESGVAEVMVRHADGVTERAALAAYSRPSSREWRAALPTVVPGDVFTLDAYTRVSDAFWEQTGQGSVGDTDMGNTVALGAGASAGDFLASDLEARSASVRFSIIKRYLTKRCLGVDEKGAVEWEIFGNEAGKSTQPENIAGSTLIDELGPDQVFAGGTATVVYYNQDGTRAGTDSIVLKEGSRSFSYTVPAAYGTCGFTMTYRSKITDWDTYAGPAKSYSNTVRGLWDITAEASATIEPRGPKPGDRPDGEESGQSQGQAKAQRASASAARTPAASARDLPATGDGALLAAVAALVLAGLCALAAARGLHRMGER